MLALKHRQAQGLHATATREERRRVRRAEGSEEGRHVERASPPSPTGQGAPGLLC
jgi:hypothetical protein